MALNRSGVKSTTYGSTQQILANVDLQSSVGCIVPTSLVASADANGKKIAKAGTPININLESRQSPVSAPAAGGSGTSAVPMNAVLLHDVDVTDGNANGTALIFGFVDLNKIDSTTQSAISTAKAITGSTTLITFMK